MPEALFEPVSVRYLGLYADQHFVDAQQFGRSITGVSKIANSICHLLLFSEITHDPRSYRVRFFVGPSKENGYLQEIFALVNSGVMPLFPAVSLHIAKIFVEYAFDFMIKRASGRPAEADVVIDVLKDEVARANAQNDKLIEETIQSKRWLQNQFERLVPENRASLRDAADPVGKTVRTMKIGNEPSISPIDEASADVLRSHKELSVGDVGEYKVNLEGVFKTNGACRVKLAGTHKIISGKITDPSVGIAGNIYTRALNEGATLVATAKPTLQNGEINRLFISNARIADE